MDDQEGLTKKNATEAEEDEIRSGPAACVKHGSGEKLQPQDVPTLGRWGQKRKGKHTKQNPKTKNDGVIVVFFDRRCKSLA